MMLKHRSLRHVQRCFRPRLIDLRSDTVTLPSLGQRNAMAICDVGDDIKGEDRTVKILESRMADLLGKQVLVMSLWCVYAV